MRWTSNRKREIVRDVRSGMQSSEAVCKQYNLSKDELKEWMEKYYSEPSKIAKRFVSVVSDTPMVVNSKRGKI